MIVMACFPPKLISSGLQGHALYPLPVYTTWRLTEYIVRDAV